MSVFPNVQVIPLPDDKASFQIGGREVLRYHFAKSSPKPYFFPLLGPAGHFLTRIGHPHDPEGHRHHRSIWVGHQKVNGFNFWEEVSATKIEHQRVLAYQERSDSAQMKVLNFWLDPAGKPVMEEERWTTVRTLSKNQVAVDVRLTFRPKQDHVIFEKTSFGFLAVRVAKTMSVADGEGKIRNSEGQVNEAGVHWKRAKWVDYSGPVAPDVWNGVLFMDHPNNPRHPTYWHVRDDGWMGASFCYREPWQLQGQELTLNYRLLVHDGLPPMEELQNYWKEFAREAL